MQTDSSSDRTWRLADAAYFAFQRWYVLVFFMVAGGLLGWAIAMLAPTSFRAQAHIYVALNPYRMATDTVFQTLANPKYSNIDNYQYWQLSQLESVIQLDVFMQDTLARLQVQDPDWGATTPEQLRAMLSSEWRSAGRWNLTAQGADPTRLEQAAQAWQAVTLERIPAAISAAQAAIRTDQELQAQAAALTAAQTRQVDLTGGRAGLAEWAAALDGYPPAEPLPPAARWQVLALVSGLAEFTPGWQVVLAAQPPVEAPPEAYRAWAAQVDAFLAQELVALQTQLDFLAAERRLLDETYRAQFDASLGLSPNIELEALGQTPAESVRAPELLVLVGFLSGGLLWLLLVVVRLSRIEARK